MTEHNQPKRRRKIIAGIVGLAVAGATALTMAFTGGGSGAYFTASGSGTATVDTGSLKIHLGDAHGTSDSFKLVYANLAPGQTATDKLYVENDGSVKADVSISGLTPTAFSPVPSNPGLLTASIDGYLSPTPATSVSPPVQLGSLNPGQGAWYNVNVGLDSSAGNDWQNVHVAANVTVSLNQSH